MAFNALMDCVSLILLLGMVGAYVVRKEITMQYRTYTFFVVYWLNMIVFIKFSHDIIIKIPFVEEHLKTEKDKFTDANNLIFGGKAALFKDDMEDQKAIYYTCLLLCIFFTHNWKMVKWWEIREKTTKIDRHGNEVPNSSSIFSVFKEYMIVRD
jgi:hypothetical protein